MRRMRIVIVALVMAAQAGCGSLAKPVLPSLENPDFRKQLTGSVHVEAAPSRLMAGMAKRDITPPAGTPLSGYGRRKGRPSQGVHDPLHVRVIALKDQTDFLVFASCDLVAINQELYQAVLQNVRSRSPLEKAQLFLSATHTHSGSGGIGKHLLERIISGRYRKDVFLMTVDRISEAILEAVNHMKPAAAGLGSTQLDGMIENRMIEGGLVDSGLSVLKIETENGPPGFLVNLAAHPTVLNAGNLFFSADFPGFLQQTVEAKFPGALCLFTNGAGGDQRIRGFNEAQGFARAEAIGEKLGEILLEMTASIPVEKQAEIITLQAPLRLPPVKIRYGLLRPPSFIGNRLIERHVVCNTARLNDIVFISIPGEMTGELGLEIKKEAGRLNLNALILGYTNGYIGYIVPEKYYRVKTYESSVSFFGPRLDRYFFEGARAQIRFLKEGEHEAGRQGILTRASLESREGIPVLHLEGTSYEIGYQHGVLLKEKVRQATRQILDYFPKKIKIPIFGKIVFNFLVDRSYRKLAPHIPQEYKEEMKGLADGSGVSLRKIHRVHAIPELYSTLCANGAFFGKATADGRLYHLRNLDWNREIGIQDYLCLFAVKKKGALPFVNIGYISFLGALSGMNAESISIGQVGSETKDQTLKGTPMPFLLRQVLEKARSVDEAAQIILNAKRTIGCNYVFADAKNRKACALETTAHHAAVFYDQDPKETASPYALPLGNAVMRSDFAVDPVIRDLQTCAAGNPKKPGLEDPRGSGAYDRRYKGQADFAKAHYGSIAPNAMFELAKVIAPGSNVQSVVYGFPYFWAATAKGKARAVDSGYRKFNVLELLGSK